MSPKKKSLIAACGMAALLLAAVVVFYAGRPIGSYGSGPEGVVLDSSGNPIGGAEVTIYFEETVFDAITPIKKVQLTTTSDGRFHERLISCGKPGGWYRVTVKKPGYDTAVVSGQGMGVHRIVLATTETRKGAPSNTSLQPARTRIIIPAVCFFMPAGPRG